MELMVIEVEGFLYMNKENDLVIRKAKGKEFPTAAMMLLTL
jgi:hypothetical protein